MFYRYTTYFLLKIDQMISDFRFGFIESRMLLKYKQHINKTY